MFQNLLGNAIKYRRYDQAPAIEVLARKVNNYWHFTVADNGIGIPGRIRRQFLEFSGGYIPTASTPAAVWGSQSASASPSAIGETCGSNPNPARDPDYRSEFRSEPVRKVTSVMGI